MCTRSERRARDTVVLVMDPLGREGGTEKSSRGEAESEGIKMACPPREVGTAQRRCCRTLVERVQSLTDKVGLPARRLYLY